MSNHVQLIAAPQAEDSLAPALGRAHSKYALALNQGETRSGHVWQGRFFSCPMDASHLLSAMRYVELNPLRAKLAASPWGWPSSSARAHTMDGAIDSLLDCHWMEHLDGCSPGLRILAATDRYGEAAIEVIGELPHLAFLEVIDPAM